MYTLSTNNNLSGSLIYLFFSMYKNAYTNPCAFFILCIWLYLYVLKIQAISKADFFFTDWNFSFTVFGLFLGSPSNWTFVRIKI